MKAEIADLKDSFKFGYEVFEASRQEAAEVWDLYHNRQFTVDQLAVLANRGQPAETFNIIKMFARMLVGYYSTVVNTAVAMPTNPRDVNSVSLLNDTIAHVFESNRFDIEGDTIKLQGMISGLLCAYCAVADTGKKDRFGRPINKIVVHHVPDDEIILDPSSSLDDYSDAAFLHRFRWLTKDKMKQLFGAEAVKDLTPNTNFTDAIEADAEYNYGTAFTGSYVVFDNYLVVHSVIVDEDGKRWSCFWHDDKMLKKQEITYAETKWPYRVQKLHSSNKKEYYGIFREVVEAQKAINQAVIKIQLMVSTEKAFVEDGAVENLDDFTNAFNRVNSVIPVKNLSGVKIETMTREIQEQYIIIDRALDRVQRVLGINDSFLGMAFASDSGRKVKLQQNATIMSLRYITARIESFYTSLGWDIANLIKQYFTAHQILMVADEIEGQRYIEINKPIEIVSMGPNGQPVTEPVMLPVYDPGSNEPMIDSEGNFILAPVPEEGTDFEFTEFQVKVKSSSYNDEDEKAQLMLESVMSGQIGQMMAKVNPAGFFKISSLALRTMKTKYSGEISTILDQTAMSLSGNPQASQDARAAALGEMPGAQAGPMSKSLKLPQNTNEGVE